MRLKSVVMAMLVAVMGLIVSPAAGQLVDTRFPVTQVGTSASSDTLGLAPDAPGNDYTQTYQPTLAKAQQTSALINAALTKYNTVTFTTPGTYYIGSQIDIFLSNRSLVATVPGVVIKMHSSMVDYTLLVGQSDLSGISARNLGNPTFNSNTVSNITIRGIEFQRSGQGGSGNGGGPGPGYPAGWIGHSVWLSNFRNVKIEDCSFTCYTSAGDIGGGKYQVLINNGQGFYARNIRFQTSSDGIHFQGPFSDGFLENISGFTGDNMVAFIQGDDPRYETTYGNIRRVSVKNIFTDVPRLPNGTPTTWGGITPVGCIQPFRFGGHDGHWSSGVGGGGSITYTSDGYEISDILVENLSGPIQSGNHSISFLNDINNPNAAYVVVKRVSLTKLAPIIGTSVAVVHISSPNVYDVTIDDLSVPGNGYAIEVTTVTNARLNLTCNNARNIAATSASHLFQINGPIGVFKTTNCEMTIASTANVSFLNQGSTSTITRWIGDNLSYDATGTGGSCRFILGNGVITSATLSNVSVTAANYVWAIQNTLGRSKYRVQNLNLNGVVNTVAYGRADIKVDGYAQSGKCEIVASSGTGRTTFFVEPQWTSVQLYRNSVAQEAGSTVFNDFCTAVSQTDSKDLNGITRFANIAGQGFLPRGYVLHRWSARTLTSFAGTTLGTVKLTLGTTAAGSKFGVGTTDLVSASTSVHEYVEVPAASKYDDETVDRNINLQTINSGAGFWNASTAGAIDLRLNWGIEAISN